MTKKQIEKKIIELTGIYGYLYFNRAERKYQFIQCDNNFNTGRVVKEFDNKADIEEWIFAKEMEKEEQYNRPLEALSNIL